MDGSAKTSASRQRILEAARGIFFEKGFERANLDEIALRAGVAKGTIYRYFENKAELYVQVLVLGADAFVERLNQTIDPALPPDDQIRRIGRFYLEHYSENREYFRIFWAVENQRMIGGLSEALVCAVTAIWRRCLAVLADQVDRGIREGVFRPCDPWETADILWLMANGLIQTDSDPERRSFRKRSLLGVYESSVEILLRGLRPPA